MHLASMYFIKLYACTVVGLGRAVIMEYKIEKRMICEKVTSGRERLSEEVNCNQIYKNHVKIKGRIS